MTVETAHQDRTDTKFLFVGTQLWLDFVNTEIVSHGQRMDLLDSFAAFVAWLREGNVFGVQEIAAIERNWRSDVRMRRSLDQARAFRSVLRGLADQITHDHPVPETAIQAINDTLRHRTGYTEIVAAPDGFERRMHGDLAEPEHLLTPMAESVTDFLCQSDWTLLKHCENPACVLYFYDKTKNHTRRWCSMSGCGNRMKAAAHYRRVKAAKENSQPK